MTELPLYDPDDVDDLPVQCPACKSISRHGQWDCLGADEGKLFCPDCQAECEPVEVAP